MVAQEEVLLGKAANGVGAFGSAALVLRRPAAFALPLVCGVAVLLSLRQFLQVRLQHCSGNAAHLRFIQPCHAHSCSASVHAQAGM